MTFTLSAIAHETEMQMHYWIIFGLTIVLGLTGLVLWMFFQQRQQHAQWIESNRKYRSDGDRSIELALKSIELQAESNRLLVELIEVMRSTNSGILKSPPSCP